MAILRSFTEKEMSFEKAVERAKTGERISISLAPQGIERGIRYPHMQGLLSTIRDDVFLNDTLLCRSDSEKTHGKFYSFYDSVLLYKRVGKVHKFFWIWPSDPDNPKKNTLIAHEPAFGIESDEEIDIFGLSTGKGLIIILTDNKTDKKRIFLLKKPRFLYFTWDGVSPKDVPLVWNGDTKVCLPTPNSVITVEETTEDGVTITRYWIGHEDKRRCIHTQLSKMPFGDTWATTDDFFYKIMMQGVDHIFSASSGKSVHSLEPMDNSEFFETADALVRRNGTLIRTNDDRIVTDEFPEKVEWITAHAHGLLYGCGGWIRMLVIKGTK